MAEGFDTTDDTLLDGRLKLRQPKKGYRAGMDAVLLGSAVACLRYHKALDAGCGVGGALLSAALLSGHDGRLAGLEKDESAASLAAHNVDANGVCAAVDVFVGDVLAPPKAMRGAFDLVFSNPPFFDDERAIRPPAEERAAAWVSGVPLEDWIKAMARLAAPKGRLMLLHRADRLPDILTALQGRAGEAYVFPVRPRSNEPAKRVIVCARIGSRAPLRLASGIDLHPVDGEALFTPEAARVFAGQGLEGFAP